MPVRPSAWNFSGKSVAKIQVLLKVTGTLRDDIYIYDNISVKYS
jgi:hypothetical protein